MAGPDGRSDSALGSSILGRRFEARGVPPAMAEWLRAHWCFPEHDDQAPSSDYAIVLEVGGLSSLAERVDDDGLAFAEPASTAPGWRGSGDAWEMGTPDGGVRLSLGVTEARIHVWGVDANASAADCTAALHLALTEAVRASGLVPLHAAVAANDGRATALLGASGTGKSTTLVRLIRDGWAPIAEDFSWLDPETLVVYGWDRGIRLWPEGHAHIGDAAGEGWRMGVDGKLFLDYAALGAGAARRRGMLSRLALLVRDGSGAPGWEPLAMRDAVRALWEAMGVPLSPRIRERAARQMPGLLARVETRRLRLGHTPASL